MKKTIIVEFIFSNIANFVSALVFLSTSKILDNYTKKYISNLIALILDLIIDFIMQSFVFFNKLIITDINIVIKFLIFKLIIVFLNQLLFIIYIIYINYDIEITFIRAVIGLIVVIFVGFPLTKYFVFRKQNKTKLIN